MRIHELAAAAMIATTWCGCHAQVRADAQAQRGEDDDRRWEQPDSERSAGTPSPPSGARSASAGLPAAPMAGGPYGVVHDLTLAPSTARDVVCSCLAVALGPAADARFTWQPSASTPPADAWAVAITSEGVPCDRPGASIQRPSIAGVTREGDNVVLTVENVREGTPVVHGALLPRPAAGAQLLVRGRGRVRGIMAPIATRAREGECRIAVR